MWVYRKRRRNLSVYWCAYKCSFMPAQYLRVNSCGQTYRIWKRKRKKGKKEKEEREEREKKNAGSKSLLHFGSLVLMPPFVDKLSSLFTQNLLWLLVVLADMWSQLDLDIASTFPLSVSPFSYILFSLHHLLDSEATQIGSLISLIFCGFTLVVYLFLCSYCYI